MREGVDQNAVQCTRNRIRAWLAERRSEECAGFERRVFRVWQIEQSELSARLFAEPALQKRSHRFGRRGPELHGDIVLWESPGGEVCSGMGFANGDK